MYAILPPKKPRVVLRLYSEREASKSITPRSGGVRPKMPSMVQRGPSESVGRMASNCSLSARPAPQSTNCRPMRTLKFQSGSCPSRAAMLRAASNSYQYRSRYGSCQPSPRRSNESPGEKSRYRNRVRTNAPCAPSITARAYRVASGWKSRRLFSLLSFRLR